MNIETPIPTIAVGVRKKPFLIATIAAIAIGALLGAGGNFSVAGAILLCVFYVFGVWENTRRTHSAFAQFSDGKLVALFGALHGLMILTAYLAGAPPEAFWVPDALNQHLPRSENMAAFLRGEGDLRGMHVIWDKFYLAQIVTGIGFAVFGKSPIVSSLAMVLIKTLASFFVMKSAAFFRPADGDRRIEVQALWLFAFNPMVIFHTSVFYKEAGVYFVMALLGYCLLKVLEKRSWSIGLAVSLLLLLNERFYFGVFYAGGITLAVLTTQANGLSKKLKFTLAGFGVAVGLMFVYFYSGHISVFKIWDFIQAQRVAYLSYSDVSEINRTLVYPAAVVKLFFSPYFTFGKVADYNFFAQLIPWGAVVHQSLLLFGLIGLVRAVFQRNVECPVVLSRATAFVLVVFLLMFGYVAPYAGRLRDTILPILLLYSCVEIARFFDRVAARNKISTAAA
ncbi:MAG: hypothetical protein U1E10_17325 [Bdellovibrionales bacterium]|nr:hypothetical protein [Bdellovibrionales bacterium]